MSQQVKREVLEHLAFAAFFLAGLFTTDFFMGEPAQSSGTANLPATARAQGSATTVSPPTLPLRRTAWLASSALTPTQQQAEDAETQATQDTPLSGPDVATASPTSGEPAILDDNPLAAARRLEQQRIEVIRRIAPAVVAVFGLERAGGGSGVVIHPSGLALTNHHVIAAAGATGWGGLADGKLYRWELIGNDPGGDLALIRLIHDQPGGEFPCVKLGDSDQVQVGDWTLVLGNPFTLAEDYTPTVTYGIVSGVQRYQPGMSDTLLVYGNCIQVDTSINPGNSGGPLFNVQGELIGINGRASFEFRQRGRVNVGLGYAISVNQCRHFLPELMATKLIQHGTLDALFGDRDGRVLCTAIYDDADIAALGLELGDELLEFEGRPVTTANQFTNWICTLPAGWPAQLKIRKADGRTSEIRMRLIGLPYPKMDSPPPAAAPPPRPNQPPGAKIPAAQVPDPNSLQEQIQASRMALYDFMSAPPGHAQNTEQNANAATLLWQRWATNIGLHSQQPPLETVPTAWQITERWSNAAGQSTRWTIACDTVARTIEVTYPAPLENVATADASWDWQEIDPSGLAGARLRYREQRWWRQAPAAADAETWEEVPVAQLLRSPLGLQLWWLTHGLLLPDSSTPALKLDGADRIDHHVTARLEMANQNAACYLWLSLDDWTAPADSQLLKLSTDINGRASAGAVCIEHWDNESPLPWPSHRRLVRGLFQDPIAEIATESITPAPSTQTPTP